MSVTPNVSAVIVTYNVKPLVLDCLRSIREATVLDAVVIVDNASQDGTAETIKEQFPDWEKLAILRNDKNRGFAKATNQGIAGVSGKYVLLLNPDTIVSAGVVTRMAECLDEKPGVGVLGCKLVYPDGTLQSQGERFTTPWEVFKTQILFSKTWRRLVKPSSRDAMVFQSADYVTGACLMTRRKVLEQIGLLDERYFLYGEDMEFCLRARRAGWEVGVLSTAEVVHLHSKSVETDVGLAFYQSAKNGVANVRMLSGEGKARLALMFYAGGVLLRALIAPFRRHGSAREYFKCFADLMFRQDDAGEETP